MVPSHIQSDWKTKKAGKLDEVWATRKPGHGNLLWRRGASALYGLGVKPITMRSAE
jgi:hypothetical protein